MSNDDFSSHMSTIDIGFEEVFFFPNQKDFAFTLSAFLGNIGGIMGLLAGVSVLSLVETFHHFLSPCVRRFFKSFKATKVYPIKSAADQQQKMSANEDHTLYQFLKYVIKFFRVSDIHGVRYTIDQNQKKHERVFWALIVFGSVVACFWLIQDVFKHSEKVPVVTGIDTNVWSVENVSNLAS